MNAIMKPLDLVEARMNARRKVQFEALKDALEDIVLDRDLPLDVSRIIDHVQNALEKRQALHNDIEPIYANLEVINDSFSALISITEMNLEKDLLIDRAEKLEDAKINFSKVEVMA